MEDKTFHELVRKHVESEMRDHFDAVEKACELSLQGGTCGVVILGHRLARPPPRVPYGQVWDASACPSEFE